MVIVGLSNQADSAAAMAAGLGVAESVQFSKPNQAAGAGNSPLSGKHLLYMYSGNGYSERKDIYLCASGGFYHSSSLGGFYAERFGRKQFRFAAFETRNMEDQPERHKFDPEISKRTHDRIQHYKTPGKQ